MRAILDSVRRNFSMRKGFRSLSRYQPSEALAAFERALDWAPKNPFTHLWIGLVLADLEKYDTAVERLCQAIDLKPTNLTFQAFLGQIYLDQGALNNAQEVLRPLATGAHKDRLASALYVIVLVRKGQLKEGYQQLVEALPKFRNPAIDSRVVLACEEYLFPYPDVAHTFEENLTFDNREPAPPTVPQRDRSIVRRVWLYVRFPFNPTRREAYSHALSGDAFREKRWWKESIHHYTIACELAPDESIFLQRLTQAYMCDHDYQGALHYLEKSERSKKSRGATVFQYMKGVALYGLQRHLEAKQVLLEAYEGIGEDPFLMYYLGLCCLGTGEQAEARMWFAKAASKLRTSLGADLARIRLEEALRVSHVLNGNVDPEASPLS